MQRAVRESKGRTLVVVHVVPRAARTEVCGMYGDALRIRVHATPSGGAANAALIELLADVLQLPQRNLEIVAGLTSRRKTVAVVGLGREQVLARLDALTRQGQAGD
jgi:uncharacterized protein (TIGR00251 family)